MTQAVQLDAVAPATASPVPEPAPGGRRRVLRRLLRPTYVVAAVFLVLLAVAAVLSGVLPVDPNAYDAVSRLRPPSAQHLLGTDQLGRDVLTRVVYGARASLTVGAVTAVVCAVLGTAIGVLCASFRWVDAVVMRIVDGVMSFPIIILALALMAILGSSLTTVVVSLVIVLTPGMARVIRSRALVVSRLPMIDTARMAGAGRRRVLTHYVLPECLTAVLVQAGVVFTVAVLIESGLSFIGAGIPPTTPSWGGALAEARGYLTSAWWMWVAPGGALVLTVLAANLLLDGLRDALDPSRRS